MSDFPGATSLSRPKNHFGGLDEQPGRRRLIRGTPGIVFSKANGSLPMIALRLNELRQHSDIVRLRSGGSLMVRFVEPRDAEGLQGYFRSLSVRSRYNRFLGAMSELPQTELDHFIHVGEGDRFSVIAVMMIDGVESIVGEARSAFGAKHLFGDTLRSNDVMIGLARKSGFAFRPNPGDWKLVRFEKHIDLAPQEIPCASWRLAIASLAVSGASAN